METTISHEYPCAQKDAYSVLDTAWDNYLQHLAAFSAYKPGKYTAALAAQAKLRIKMARELPDNQARSGLAEELRIGVELKGAVLLNDFQLLKGYIDEAYQGDDVAYRKPNYEEAGQLYYRDASRGDWESVMSLGDSMRGYITLKLSVLMTNGQMPASFETTVSGHFTDFEQAYSAYKQAEQTQVATAEKVAATNACYREGIDMMKDGQRLFVHDVDIKALFVFNTILDMINPRVAGVKGRIQAAVTNVNVVGAKGTFSPEGEPAVLAETDENGEYALLRLRAGTYHVKWEMEGFVPVEEDVVIELQTVKTKNYKMSAI